MATEILQVSDEVGGHPGEEAALGARQPPDESSQ